MFSSDNSCPVNGGIFTRRNMNTKFNILRNKESINGVTAFLGGILYSASCFINWVMIVATIAETSSSIYLSQKAGITLDSILPMPIATMT